MSTKYRIVRISSCTFALEELVTFLWFKWWSRVVEMTGPNSSRSLFFYSPERARQSLVDRERRWNPSVVEEFTL